MRERIRKHIQTVTGIMKCSLPFSFISEYGEEACQDICRRIEGLGLEGVLQHLTDKSQACLIKDPPALKYIKALRENGKGFSIRRLEGLLSQEGEERLSELDFLTVQKVFADEEVPANLQYLYARYFMKDARKGAEKEQVLRGLDKFRRELHLDLGELSKEARSFLGNPLFRTHLLRAVLGRKSAWEILTRPDVVPVLQTIYDIAPHQELSNPQFTQIGEAAERIKSLLAQGLPCLEKEDQASFVIRWLENNALLDDLKRLVPRLPHMGAEEKKALTKEPLSYVIALHRTKLDQIDIETLSAKQKAILIHAIVEGKTHFLRLVDTHSEVFQKLRYYSMLLDPDTYRTYLNVNTLNEKNLKDSVSLSGIHTSGKQYLNRPSYTFEELKTLSGTETIYYQMYDRLTIERSDDRLRVLKELRKQEALPAAMNEEALSRVSARLSEKPLSSWMQDSLGHVKELRADTVIRLLEDWEDYERFLPDLTNGRQAEYLVRNRDWLKECETFDAVQEAMMKKDHTWLWLWENMALSDAFVRQYEDHIRPFVYRGDALILYAFCQENDHKIESLRRLLTAELMGKFRQVKYHEGDLIREIAYPLDERREHIWMENRTRKEGQYEAWEEDRFIPVLKIGEIPTPTCLSYRDGSYKKCLLSCFDANKKVIYVKNGKTIVFRALIRLTKGSFSNMAVPDKTIEFVDLTKEESKTERGEKHEELVLFLERLYTKGLNPAETDQVVSCVYHLVCEKAKTLQARLVISQDYKGYKALESYQKMEYYMYISASKNGEQYLDSLGGEATVRDSGSYARNFFLLSDQTKEAAA